MFTIPALIFWASARNSPSGAFSLLRLGVGLVSVMVLRRQLIVKETEIWHFRRHRLRRCLVARTRLSFAGRCLGLGFGGVLTFQ